MLTEASVRTLANEYRAALVAGDSELTTEDERLIFRAVLVASMQKCAYQIRTRVENGDLVSGPLETLMEDMRKKDYVGKSLEFLRTQLIKEAKSLVVAGTFTASSIFIGTMAIAVIGGCFVAGGLFIGKALGFSLALVGALGSIGTLVVSRLAVGAAAAFFNSGADKALTSAGRLTFLYPFNVGASARSLFYSRLQPSIDENFGPRTAVSHARPVVAQVRGGSGFVLVGSAVAAVVFVVILVGGVSAGVENYKQWELEQKLKNVDCPSFLTDKQCENWP